MARRARARTLAARGLPVSAALAAALAAAAWGAAAQELSFDREAPVALVADSVVFDEASGTVTAVGDVEVYHGDRTLTAASITYDSRAERITAEGPITLRDPSGAVIVADFADLDPELQDGVIRGAQAVIGDGAGRLAAVEGRRIDGRYNALSKAVYSSCEVCLDQPTPLWSIRARRIVHDEQEKTIYYEDAVFEVLGQPIAYLPFFYHPDPTVERKSGFLAPTFGGSSTYGYFAKVPYFFVIDPSRDATLTPFVTTDDGPILEFEYRQRLDIGGFEISGSGGWLDTASDGGFEARGHVFGRGRFDVSGFGLGEKATAGFDLELASDKGYLRRYDFYSEPRLQTEVFLEDYERNDFYDVRGYYFQTLRDTESQSEIPFVVPDFALRREVDDPFDLGALGFEASGATLVRPEGRDQTRFTGLVDWEGREILDNGLALGAFASARGDLYLYNNDAAFNDGSELRFAPQAGVEAFYPLIAERGGTAHVFEPGVQLIAAPTSLNPEEIENEDSLIVEFDETNVFDRNRAAGFDRIESGTRVNVGLSYSRIARDPLRLNASVGQVFRLSDDTAFGRGTGLEDDVSDFVGAWSIGWGPWFRVANRFRVSDDFVVNRNELRGEIEVGRLRVNAGYSFLESDATAGALVDREEATLGAELALHRHWTLGGFMRRDLENDDFVNTSGALTYRDECASLEFYVARDFVETDDAPASTSFGVRVRIFGAPEENAPRSAACAAVR